MGLHGTATAWSKLQAGELGHPDIFRVGHPDDVRPVMLVVYVLSDASNPTQGLGLYTVYFMAALLGLDRLCPATDFRYAPMAVDVPSVAAIGAQQLHPVPCCGPASRSSSGDGYLLGGICLPRGWPEPFSSWAHARSCSASRPCLRPPCSSAWSAGLMSAWRCSATQRNLGRRYYVVLAALHDGRLALPRSRCGFWFAGKWRVQRLCLGTSDFRRATASAYALVAIGFLASVR